MLSISFGSTFCKEAPMIPSITTSGETLAPTVDNPLNRITLFSFGSPPLLYTCKPATLPWSNSAGSEITPWLKSSAFTSTTADVISFSFCEPYPVKKKILCVF